MHSPIPSASPQCLLQPLLAALQPAAVSLQSPEEILPLLSPILRQRVKFLSGSAEEPSLSLLCYDQAKVSSLLQIVQGENFEPHPVSGDVEVDWETMVDTRYNRVDEETLQALVNLRELGLIVKLVWCIDDQEGGSDGWRICEVTVPASDGRSQEGWENIEDAEREFEEIKMQGKRRRPPSKNTGSNHSQSDDDDVYWAQYDSSPDRTPTVQSPPLGSSQDRVKDYSDEDAYYDQYAYVQPAMDNHDPDEAIRSRGIETSLGKDEPLPLRNQLAHLVEPTLDLVQPQPTSNGKSSEDTVVKLEETAAVQRQSEIAVKQHVSSTIKSLFRLARASGIVRAEFERVVKTELDVLGLIEDDD